MSTTPRNTAAKEFLNILDMFDLSQHVHSGTHTSGQCLDLVITRQNDSLVRTIVVGPLISDHFLVLCKLDLRNLGFEKKKIVTRKTKGININALKTDINDKMASLHQQNHDTESLLKKFSAILRNVLDRHAPMQSRFVSQNPRCLWVNEDILTAKRDRRRAEIRLNTDNTTENRALYKNAKNRVNELCDIAKRNHF